MELAICILIVIVGSVLVIGTVKAIARHVRRNEEMSVKENLETRLYELDEELVEYREKKNTPGTKEYEDAKIVEELFSKPFTFSKSIEQKANDIGLAGLKVSYTPANQKDL